MRIRPAVRSDAATLHEVLAAAFDPWVDRYTEGAFAATVPPAAVLTRRLDEGPVWVAVLDRDGAPGAERILGTIGAVEGDGELYLRSFAVAPEAQGKGVGAALLDRAESHARTLGVERIRLSTTPFLRAAILLYRRQGYRRTSAGPHDLEGTPLLTMEKVLSGERGGTT